METVRALSSFRGRPHGARQRYASVLAAALTLVFAAGCAPVASDGTSDTTGVSVAIDFSGTGTSQGTSLSMQPLAEAVDDVQRVTVDVSRDGTPLVTGIEATDDGQTGARSATIASLPVGVPLTITAHAYDGDDVEIFSGTTQVTLSDTTAEVVVDMASTDTSVLTLPRIVGIQVPDQILPDASAQVSVSIEGSAGETVQWALTADAGSFSPSNGQVQLSASGTDTLMVTYSAPSRAGTDTPTVRVTNSAGNSVTARFPMVVSNGQAHVGMRFAPVVTAITGSRDGDTVTWTATVDDDAAPLHYAWSADLTGGNDPAFSGPANTNPADLVGYDETVEGTVTLQVRDAHSLSTTVNILVSAGQFPDQLVTPVAQGFQFVDDDGVPELTNVPKLTPATFGAGDRIEATVPVDSDVGYLTACLYANFADAAGLDEHAAVACANDRRRSPETGNDTMSLHVPGNLASGGGYWVLVKACSSRADCASLTGTVYTAADDSRSYARQAWSDGALVSSVNTGVVIPTYVAESSHGGGRH